ncbi:MAG: nucleotide sugar dehydrogenase [Lentisphaeraceae bacterium]|nr:nucleotide sugar dehydrogenase [Lentisphaeraceae bacterium]
MIENRVVAVIGLGYVGLPLAVEFSKKYKTIGFDVKSDRITALQEGKDSTREISREELVAATNLSFTSDTTDIHPADIYIVTVPTPVDNNKQPDMTPLRKASQTVGEVISQGNIVIYESTVYPGATEEVCLPIVEEFSGLIFNKDFFAGYSPERINPGDKLHRLPDILKVTSGSTSEVADFVDSFYGSIITAGTHKASSMKVAEAAKVIENTQRDLNIALVNELSLIFNKLGIDTQEVLEAAGTKWNFLPFRPGLVGGHCIGVDPYYLTFKAQEVGYHPEIILAGRRINDGMGSYVAKQVVKLMIKEGYKVAGAKVLILGITFKENCPDIRNSRVIDVIDELQEFSCDVIVHDPWADKAEVKQEYGIDLLTKKQLENESFDAIVLAVAHEEFIGMDFAPLSHDRTIIYDIKAVCDKDKIHGRL